MGPFKSRAGLCLACYLPKELYDEIVKLDKDVTEFVDKAVEEALKKEEQKEKEEAMCMSKYK
jgi:hypothetical protein